MKIKKITKLPSDWYEVIIEYEGKTETFKLTDDLLIEHQIIGKKTFDPSQYEQLKKLADYAKCYRQALNYLSYRMRTEKEMRDYLTKKDCPLDDQERIISKLKHLKYIDDALFAKLYTKEKVQNYRGPIWIKNQLIKKGIHHQLAQSVVEKVPSKSFNEQMVLYIKKLDRTHRKKPIIKRKDSIVRTLLNRGYVLDAINDALSSYEFEPLKNEMKMVKKEAEKAFQRWNKKYEGYELRQRLMARLTQKGYSYPLIKEVIDELLKAE